MLADWSEDALPSVLEQTPVRGWGIVPDSLPSCVSSELGTKTGSRSRVFCLRFWFMKQL